MKKLFFVCLLWVSCTVQAQVAIDLPTNQIMDPLAAFQVCGTVRIDSLPLSIAPTYVLLLDATDTLLHKMSFASFVTLISQTISTTTIPITHLYTSTTTWAKPAGLKYVVVEIVGGGGGGAGSGIARGQFGGGGGGGGYTRKTISSLALSTTENIVIGIGGTGGAINGGTGANGTTSSFGTHCSSTGGNGAWSVSYANAQGGIGGVGIGGDINITGNGGGGGAVIGNGIATTGGTGGGSFFGGGGTGAGVDANGLNGSQYGGGGSGGSFTNATRRIGGRGADGAILITEYY